MFYDLHLMISTLTILLSSLPVAVSVVNPTDRNDSTSSPPILLPHNTPDLRRDSNSTVLNNITSNITSGSEKFLWIIQDTYAAPNFFDYFSFYTGSDPTHGTVEYAVTSSRLC